MNTEPINYSVYDDEVRRNDTPKHVYTSDGLSVNSRAKDESEFIQYLNEKENHEETEPETDTNIYNDEFEDSPKHEHLNELEKLENNSYANVNELQDFEEEFYKTDQPADANYISDEFEINLTKKQIRERRRPVNQQIKELSSDVTSLKNDEVQEAEQQQIREKRKPINQQLQELSSSSNDSLKNPNFKKHNLSHNFKIIAVLLLTFALFYFQQFGTNPSFFQKFLTNKNAFERMNNLYITAGHLDKLRINLKDEEDKLTDVTYELCNEDGKVIEIDLKYLNPRITTGLHNCGEKLMLVGKNLQSTYSKGLEVYKKFDMEIEAMKSRLNSTDDDEYFKERLNELTAMTEEFRELVEKSQSSIQYAGYIKNDTEGYIHDGLKEVEKLKAKNYNYCNSDDDAKAKKEREVVDNILNYLNSTTGHLDMTDQILKEYGYKLMGVATELEGAGKGDNSFEVDLKYLKHTLF